MRKLFILFLYLWSTQIAAQTIETQWLLHGDSRRICPVERYDATAEKVLYQIDGNTHSTAVQANRNWVRYSRFGPRTSRLIIALQEGPALYASPEEDKPGISTRARRKFPAH